MPPTTDYQTVYGRTIEELDTKVKAAVAQGWQVSGNMAFAGPDLPYRRNHHFYQTMVKTTAMISQINDKLATISTNVSAIRTSTANIDSKTPDNS